MKKFILTFVAIVCATVMADAQIYLGGSLGYHKSENSSFSVYPEIGYSLTDNHSISLVLGYEKSVTPGLLNSTWTTSAVYLSPCYTYSKMIGSTDFCFDFYAGVDFYKPDDNWRTTGFYCGPELEYYVTSNWSVYGCFDLLRFNQTFYKDDGVETELDIDFFNTGLKFGFYYYF